MTHPNNPILPVKILPGWLVVIAFLGAFAIFLLVQATLSDGAGRQATIDMPPGIPAIDPDQVNYPPANRTQADFLVPEGKLPAGSMPASEEG